jgi:hypothetical protein
MMRMDPHLGALASLREAHARMCSALSLLDLVDGTGFPAAYLQHAICLLDERFEVDSGVCERQLYQSV